MKFIIFLEIVLVALVGGFYFYRALAGNIIQSPTNYHWAWNDIIGWIDFYNSGTVSNPQSVSVTSRQLVGFASSTAGDISLDCETSRIGNICSQSTYKVSNDGSGNLSGWGWNDTYGWISFWCGDLVAMGNPSACTNSPYRVQISSGAASSTFSGYAWNDIMGWISFNCTDPGVCAGSNYSVQSTWIATSTSGTLESSTFDTGVSGGAQINSILWHGTLPANTEAGFQIAVSNNSAGPWSYFGCSIPNSNCGANFWYTGNPNSPIKLDYSLHNNARYFRYKVKLTSDLSQTLSPRVDDININWSR